MPDADAAEEQARQMRARLDGHGFPEELVELHARWAANGDEPPTLRKFDQVAKIERTEKAKQYIGWRLPAAISMNEWASASLTPDCIVELMLYCDVAALIAPGGTGKTTLILWIAIRIVLGRQLFGRCVRRKGPVLIVTAEDTREMLIARMREIADALALTSEELECVMRDVRISDVSGQGLKLTVVAEDVVVPPASVEMLIAEAREIAPTLVVIDPAISFGIGEARVNDAEQGLIEAARRIRSELNCCVLYVHHTGKQNAREKTIDQYTGRGGSSMADGARMVFVLQPLNTAEWTKVAGVPLTEGETGMVLAQPKLSYAPPQPNILICRKGYRFAHTQRAEVDQAAELHANAAQILTALQHEAAKGRQHTKNSLEALKLMPRTDCRDALSTLIARGQVVLAKCPRKGGPQHFLQVQASPECNGEPSQS